MTIRDHPWLQSDDPPGPWALGGRALLGVLLLFWGLRLVFTGVAAEAERAFFLDGVNLVFHEAGHVLFSAFGDFLHALGGTLGQLLVPVLCGAAFWRRGDPFAMAVALWWLGQNFVDIAPYVGDARAGELILLGGVTGREAPDYHDWRNLLGQLGWLSADTTLAALSYWVGRLLLLGALAWGGLVWWNDFAAYRRREEI